MLVYRVKITEYIHLTRSTNATHWNIPDWDKFDNPSRSLDFLSRCWGVVHPTYVTCPCQWTSDPSTFTDFLPMRDTTQLVPIRLWRMGHVRGVSIPDTPVGGGQMLRHTGAALPGKCFTTLGELFKWVFVATYVRRCNMHPDFIAHSG